MKKVIIIACMYKYAVAVNSPYIIGGTYDSMTQHPTATISCFKKLPQIKFGNPKAELEFKLVKEAVTVQKSLGVDAQATLGWGPFSIKAAYNYAQTIQEDAYTITKTFNLGIEKIAYINMPPMSLASLSDVANHALADKSNLSGFRKLCGDEYITHLSAGWQIWANLVLNFVSRSEENSFKTQIPEQAGFSDIFKLIEKPGHGRVKVTLNILQVGGDARRLEGLIGSYGLTFTKDKGYYAVDCAQNTKCVYLLNGMIEYAHQLSDEESKIRNSPNEVSVMNYYYTYPKTKKWAFFAPIALLKHVEVTPDSDVVLAQDKLTKSMEKDTNDLHFLLRESIYLDHIYDLIEVSDKEKESIDTLASDLRGLISKYRNIVDLYAKPEIQIMDCYRGFVGKEACFKVIEKLKQQRPELSIKETQLLWYLETHQFSTDSLHYLAESHCNTLTHGHRCELKPVALDYSEHGDYIFNALYVMDCEKPMLSKVNALNMDINESEIKINNETWSYAYSTYPEIVGRYRFNKLSLGKDKYGTFFSGSSDVMLPDGVSCNTEFRLRLQNN